MENEYLKQTKKYLQRYYSLKAEAESLREDVEMLKREIALDVTAGIAKYSDDPRGGSPELNIVEASAHQHEKKRRIIAGKEYNIERIEGIVRKIDRALAILNPEDRTYVKRHYIDGEMWIRIALDEHVSKSTVCKRGKKAVRTVAGVLFGSYAVNREGNLFHC